MTKVLAVRVATLSDIDQLETLEKTCFDYDQLSRRSFSRFVKEGSHKLLVAVEGETILGYVLNLYRRGTLLARMYSLAVSPQARGKGIAAKLISAAEAQAQQQRCFFIRLEVSVKNTPAISLYDKKGYKQIGSIKNYYENGDDAWRMEKRLHQRGGKRLETKPYYQQTMDFTCGPASLMMAIKSLKSEYKMTRREELRIWRESTTIFMTSGHGGCSPHGLALSAWRRGLNVHLHINQKEAPFLDGVRDEEKKSVISLVHNDFLHQIKETDIKLSVNKLEKAELDRILSNHLPALALISTWRLNRNKAPHWVYVTDADKEFVYINDPDISDDPHETQTDYIRVPIDRNTFYDIARFGQKRLRCLLVFDVK